MNERDFGDQLAKGIRATFPRAFVRRIVDRVNLGIPDVIAVLPGSTVVPGGNGVFYALELKQLQRFLPEWNDAGRREAPLLHHPFSGPQIACMREVVASGGQALGLVRVTSDVAIKIDPLDIPPSGNFTHSELMAVGKPLERRAGVWPFWE